MVHHIEIIHLSPNNIISWHDVNLNTEMVLDYKFNRYVPPIPVMYSPNDLKDLGEFINYNGHQKACC